MRKLSLPHWWYTWEKFLEFTCACSLLPLSFLYLNFGSWKIVTNCLESLHKWPNHSSLLKKLSLDYPGHILVLFQCLLCFTYMAFKGLLCGIVVHLESQHIASKSFEILHTSPNNWLLMKKLSLAYWWYNWEKFPVFTCACSILPLSFLCLNFGSLNIFTNCLETVHKWPNQSSLLKKLSLDYPGLILVLF